MKQQTIAFVGLGAMGLHSARNLAKAGYNVRGFDLREGALKALQEAGGVACSSAAESMEGAQHAVVFVVNGAQAQQVILGRGGLAASAPKGATIISCVTMNPEEAEALGQQCKEHHLHFIDAPVSGGQVGAENGTLTIMASGDAEVIGNARNIFESFSKRLMIVGDRPGQGAMVKTINQLLCGVHLAAAGEAFAMAKRAGLDLQAVFDVVSQSAAGSWMLNDRGPRMVASSFDSPTSAVDIFVKDLGIVVDVARGMRFPVPLSATALQSFLGASGAGRGRDDDAAVMEFYKGFGENESTSR